MKKCLVVGCGGKFGAIFVEKLSAEGLSVDGIDISAGLARREELASNADCVLLCVPEAAVLELIPIFARLVKPEAVIVDIASIKTRIAEAVTGAPLRAAYLSIHPMFGPLRSFEGRNIGVVPLAENGNSAAFIGLLHRWKAKLTITTAEEHDNTVAYVQALTHAAILQMVGTLHRASIPLENIEALSTPVQTAVLALCSRIVSADPSLYWDIQSTNPFAAQARNDYAKAFAALSETVGQADYASFKQLFADLEKYLAPSRDALAALSGAITSPPVSG